LSGLLDDVQAHWQAGGRDDWLLWARANQEYGEEKSDDVVDMLERDADELIGFTLITGRKRPA
jgi:hypothetical protein